MTAKLRPGELTVRQARKEILAILARIPDGHLPKPDRIEHRGTEDVAWYGSRGWHIQPVTGSADHGRKFYDIDAVLAEEWLTRERLRRYGPDWAFRGGEQIGAAS